MVIFIPAALPHLCQWFVTLLNSLNSPPARPVRLQQNWAAVAVLEGWKPECSLVSWSILVQILPNRNRLLRCMQLALTHG